MGGPRAGSRDSAAVTPDEPPPPNSAAVSAVPCAGLVATSPVRGPARRTPGDARATGRPRPRGGRRRGERADRATQGRGTVVARWVGGVYGAGGGEPGRAGDGSGPGRRAAKTLSASTAFSRSRLTFIDLTYPGLLAPPPLRRRGARGLKPAAVHRPASRTSPSSHPPPRSAGNGSGLL